MDTEAKKSPLSLAFENHKNNQRRAAVIATMTAAFEKNKQHRHGNCLIARQKIKDGNILATRIRLQDNPIHPVQQQCHHDDSKYQQQQDILLLKLNEAKRLTKKLQINDTCKGHQHQQQQEKLLHVPHSASKLKNDLIRLVHHKQQTATSIRPPAIDSSQQLVDVLDAYGNTAYIYQNDKLNGYNCRSRVTDELDGDDHDNDGGDRVLSASAYVQNLRQQNDIDSDQQRSKSKHHHRKSKERKGKEVITVHSTNRYNHHDHDTPLLTNDGVNSPYNHNNSNYNYNYHYDYDKYLYAKDYIQLAKDYKKTECYRNNNPRLKRRCFVCQEKAETRAKTTMDGDKGRRHNYRHNYDHDYDHDHDNNYDHHGGTAASNSKKNTTRYLVKVLFPCEHRPICNQCWIRQKWIYCPVCKEEIKVAIDHHSNDDREGNSVLVAVDEYWKWVNEIKPNLPHGFTKSFGRNSKRAIAEAMAKSIDGHVVVGRVDDNKDETNDGDGRGDGVDRRVPDEDHKNNSTAGTRSRSYPVEFKKEFRNRDIIESKACVIS